MSKFGKILKAGMAGGLMNAAAKAGGASMGDVARHGGYGLLGIALAKKKREAEGANTSAPAMGGRYGVTDRGENTKDFKKGGKVKKMAKGGSTASKRADGCATKGKTKGRFV